MKIYEKIIKARVSLQNINLKKTGKNTHQNYMYYELGDFLPAVNAVCDKFGLFTHFNIIYSNGKENAVYTVYSADSDEKISFVCPTAEAKLPNGQDIQNLGAKITYLRRYMIMTAFEIAESDAVEQITKDLTDEIEAKDLELIKTAPDFETLTKVCSSLKSKYSVKLITPQYNLRKVELEQAEAK